MSFPNPVVLCFNRFGVAAEVQLRLERASRASRVKMKLAAIFILLSIVHDSLGQGANPATLQTMDSQSLQDGTYSNGEVNARQLQLTPEDIRALLFYGRSTNIQYGSTTPSSPNTQYNLMIPASYDSIAASYFDNPFRPSRYAQYSNNRMIPLRYNSIPELYNSNPSLSTQYGMSLMSPSRFLNVPDVNNNNPLTVGPLVENSNNLMSPSSYERFPEMYNNNPSARYPPSSEPSSGATVYDGPRENSQMNYNDCCICDSQYGEGAVKFILNIIQRELMMRGVDIRLENILNIAFAERAAGGMDEKCRERIDIYGNRIDLPRFRNGQFVDINNGNNNLREQRDLPRFENVQFTDTNNGNNNLREQRDLPRFENVQFTDTNNGNNNLREQRDFPRFENAQFTDTYSGNNNLRVQGNFPRFENVQFTDTNSGNKNLREQLYFPRFENAQFTDTNSGNNNREEQNFPRFENAQLIDNNSGNNNLREPLRSTANRSPSVMPSENAFRMGERRPSDGFNGIYARTFGDVSKSYHQDASTRQQDVRVGNMPGNTYGTSSWIPSNSSFAGGFSDNRLGNNGQLYGGGTDVQKTNGGYREVSVVINGAPTNSSSQSAGAFRGNVDAANDRTSSVMPIDFIQSVKTLIELVAEAREAQEKEREGSANDHSNEGGRQNGDTSASSQNANNNGSGNPNGRVVGGTANQGQGNTLSENSGGQGRAVVKQNSEYQGNA